MMLGGSTYPVSITVHLISKTGPKEGNVEGAAIVTIVETGKVAVELEDEIQMLRLCLCLQPSR